MTPTLAPMKLNHLSFPSHDPAQTSAFFAKYLGFSIALDSPLHWILKRPGFDVVIENVRDAAPHWPTTFHVGFELPTRADVEALHAAMAADGVPMETPVISHERGSRFFCRAPGGVMFELNTRDDAAEPYRGTFS
ncbi:VOC family protein [Vitiosangium sp. GDMCC 1.1324]|uniref:VOC family protein n=1 Tax=Vitiosangium sp. (strain GDMCC 1.1324) TaxID=2138576 RepID=UPI0018EEB4EC|nr:VOC family protein [Vitiosangium sp. GDMCC 1.1324]